LKVMGIDPGFSRTGFGIISPEGVRFGVIKGGRGPKQERMMRICEELERIMKKEKPDAVILEEFYYGKNARTLSVLSELKGAIIYLAGKRKIKVYEFPASEIKKGITGNGNASKEQVNRMVKELLHIEGNIPDDASDALASAYFFMVRNDMGD